jgi:hypothetical protein
MQLWLGRRTLKEARSQRLLAESALSEARNQGKIAVEALDIARQELSLAKEAADLQMIPRVEVLPRDKDVALNKDWKGGVHVFIQNHSTGPININQRPEAELLASSPSAIKGFLRTTIPLPEMDAWFVSHGGVRTPFLKLPIPLEPEDQLEFLLRFHPCGPDVSGGIGNALMKPVEGATLEVRIILGFMYRGKAHKEPGLLALVVTT